MTAVVSELDVSTGPIVCVKCSEWRENATVVTTRDEEAIFNEMADAMEFGLVSTIVFDASMRPRMHVPSSVSCDHEFVTNEEHKARKARLAEARRQAKAAHGKSAASRKSKRFTLRAKDRMECAFFSINFKKWSMRNPPRMLVLKIIGSGKVKQGAAKSNGTRYWFDTCNKFAQLMEWRRDFATRWHLAFGEELDALSVNEFQLVGGNPHIHLLLSLPVLPDGKTPRRTKHNPKSRYAKEFDDLEAWEFADKCWAEITGQPFDLSNPRRKGKVTWLAEGDAEVKPLDCVMSHVSRFVDYCRKDGVDLKKKTDQHLVPLPLQGQQVNFWAIVGFKGDRRAAGAPLVLEARTAAARKATRDFFHELSGRERAWKQIDKLDEDGNVVDSTLVEVSYWSNGRNREQGGRFHRRLSPREFTRLRRLLAYYNAMEDTGAPYDEEALLGLAFWDAEGVSEPMEFSAAIMLALLDAPPAWWELPGAEVYLDNLVSEEESEVSEFS